LAAWYRERAEHWFALATGAETPHQDGLAWFDDEWQGIVSALEVSAEVGEHELVWRTVIALNDSFRYRRLWRPLRHLTRLAVGAAAADGRPEAQGMTLRQFGQVLRHFEDSRAAVGRLEKAAAFFEEAGKPVDQAEALMNMGELLCIIGELQQSQDAFARAIRISTACGNRAQVASAMVQLGAVYMKSREFDVAMTLFEAAEGEFGELGEQPGLAWVQFYFAGAYGLLGRYAAAQERLQRGLRSNEARGDLSGQAWFLRAVGRTASLQRDWKTARRAFRREVEVTRLMKIDTADAQAELDAARHRRMVPRDQQHSGWL
jgi:tetratricopeptide (TPR) repeat protein